MGHTFAGDTIHVVLSVLSFQRDRVRFVVCAAGARLEVSISAGVSPVDDRYNTNDCHLERSDSGANLKCNMRLAYFGTSRLALDADKTRNGQLLLTNRL